MCDALQQQSHRCGESLAPRSSAPVVGATWPRETQGNSSQGKSGGQQPATLHNAVESCTARIQAPLTKQIWSRPRHLPLCDGGIAAVRQPSSATTPFAPLLCSACSDGGDVSCVTKSLIPSNMIVSNQVESWTSYTITYIKFLAEMILLYTAIQLFGSMPSIAGL